MRKLVLFDFDGTLADSAPNLALAANKQRARKGLPALPHEDYRAAASQGARGILKVGLDMDTDHPEYTEHRTQFLQDYEQDMTSLTSLFSGISDLLNKLKQHGYAWGIVTNKMEYLALPLVKHLGLANDSVITVGGDTTPHHKPHPAPLLYAAEKAGYAPADCIYVGDDERDIIAGKAAGMATIIAAYGYCGPETAALQAWRANAIADTPAAVWPAVQRWSGQTV